MGITSLPTELRLVMHPPPLAAVSERWFQMMWLALPKMWTTRFLKKRRLSVLMVAPSCGLLSHKTRSNTVHSMALFGSCGPLGRSLVGMIVLQTLVFMGRTEGWCRFLGSGQSTACHVHSVATRWTGWKTRTSCSHNLPCNSLRTNVLAQRARAAFVQNLSTVHAAVSNGILVRGSLKLGLHVSMNGLHCFRCVW